MEVEPPGNTNSGSTKINPARHWCFTYNNYTDVPLFQNILEKTCTRYIFQQETGEEGTPHLQGYIEFEWKHRPKEVIDIPQIHWEVCKDIKMSIKYCSKEDTRTGEVFAFRIPVPKRLNIITVLAHWQIKIEKIILKDPDDRTINWFWENEGGIGKTVFCKYLTFHYCALVLSGKASDMKYGIIQYINKNGCYPPIVIFDIPRSNMDFLSYTGLEEVKNGMFFSSKYESDMVLGNSPHVICFGNCEPDRNKLSKDRWNIERLTV